MDATFTLLIAILGVGETGMKFFKGAANGAFSGVLISLVLSLVVAIAVMFVFTNDEWNWPTFLSVMILMPFIIGIWVVRSVL